MKHGAVSWYLVAIGHHRQMVDWAAQFDSDFEAAWLSCPRGDWMAEWLARTGADTQSVFYVVQKPLEGLVDLRPPDGFYSIWALKRATSGFCESLGAGQDVVADLYRSAYSWGEIEQFIFGRIEAQWTDN